MFKNRSRIAAVRFGFTLTQFRKIGHTGVVAYFLHQMN